MWGKAEIPKKWSLHCTVGMGMDESALDCTVGMGMDVLHCTGGMRMDESELHRGHGDGCVCTAQWAWEGIRVYVGRDKVNSKEVSGGAFRRRTVGEVRDRACF